MARSRFLAGGVAGFLLLLVSIITPENTAQQPATMCDPICVKDYPTLKAAFAAAAGRTLLFEPGKTYVSFEELTVPNSTVIDLQGACLRFDWPGPHYLLKIESNVSILNGTIENFGGGAEEGFRQTILGYNVKNVTIRNIAFRHGMNNMCAIAMYGDVENVAVENVVGLRYDEFDDTGRITHSASVGTMFISHWWWDRPTFNLEEADGNNDWKTNHPRNIRLHNIAAQGKFEQAVWFSGSFNCMLQNLNVSARQGVFVYPGDFGELFAHERFRGKIMKGILLENITIDESSTEIKDGKPVKGRGITVTSLASHTFRDGRAPLDPRPVDVIGDVTIKNVCLRGVIPVGQPVAIDPVGIVLSGTVNTRVLGGTIERFGEGIVMANQAYGIIVDGLGISSCRWAGIRVKVDTDQVDPSRSIVIQNCKIVSNGSLGTDDTASGISLELCADVKITGNSFGRIQGEETQFHSVYLDKGCSNVRLYGNHTFSQRGQAAYRHLESVLTDSIAQQP